MGNVMHRGKGSFTFVENTIFFDHGLSAKAKGIYCQIRSLENNPEWVFTIKGFASLARDGVDAVTAGIKELESSGYIIRARKRSVNGRFLKAEEATRITLDDPAMHGEVSAELKADGFAILSEFTREPAANVEVEIAPLSADETCETGENPQFGARTGKPVSGKATSGKSAPINHSSDKGLDSDKQPPSCPPDSPGGNEKGRDDFVAYRKGEFPEAFERLCAMSIKPVSSLRFKRDCLAAWERRVAQGFAPEHIIEAYCAYADEPIPPDPLGADGEPLDMPGLAQADPDFAKLWRRVETQRCVIRSTMSMGGELPPEEDVLAACGTDGHYQRFLGACKERYDRYLKVIELFRSPSASLERAHEEALALSAMPFGGRLS